MEGGDDTRWRQRVLNGWPRAAGRAWVVKNRARRWFRVKGEEREEKGEGRGRERGGEGSVMRGRQAKGGTGGRGEGASWEDVGKQTRMDWIEHGEHKIVTKRERERAFREVTKI